MEDDEDQDGALVSYARSSGESSAEEANDVRHLWEAFLQERELKRAGKGGNVPHGGSQSSNEGHKKPTALGEKRDKASRGETRQDFSVSASSQQNVAVSNGTVDGSVIRGSLAVGSTDEVLPGQGVAGQENVSESAEVRPGQDDAGQGTALEGAVHISGEEIGQQVGEDGSNVLHADQLERSGSAETSRDGNLSLSRGSMRRSREEKRQSRRRTVREDLNKMDQNLLISAFTDGSGEGELSLALVESTSPSMVRNPAPLTLYDPHVLIQSQTTQWVMRRGVSDRVIRGAIAASAQNVCAEMVEVDVMNAQLETGKLLLQRREQGHYGKLHHPFHDNPCLPPVGNYPLSVMGVLLSPDLRHEFTNSDTFGTAMEGAAFQVWKTTLS